MRMRGQNLPSQDVLDPYLSHLSQSLVCGLNDGLNDVFRDHKEVQEV